MKYILTILIALLSLQTASAQVDTFAQRVEADTAFNQGYYRVAFEHYYEVIKVDSTRDDILYKAAICLFAEGQYEDALQMQTRAIRANDKDYANYFVRGYMFTQLKMHDLAKQDYKSSLVRLPADDHEQHANINTLLGYCYLYIRNFDSALYHANVALSHDSLFIDALHFKVNILIEHKTMDEVPQLLARLRKVAPDQIQTKYIMVWYYVNAEKYEDAVSTGEQVLLVEDNPHGIFLNNFAFAYYKLGKYKTAMKVANQAIDQEPDNSYAFKNRALIHIANGDMKNACNDLHTAQKLDFKTTYGDEVEQLLIQHCNKM